MMNGKINDNTRNVCASGLEIFEKCVLLVLYDIHVSGQSLKRAFQSDICERLGIKYLRRDSEKPVHNDHLIHGILIRLRDKDYATHIGDRDAPANQVDIWQITEKGVKFVEGKEVIL